MADRRNEHADDIVPQRRARALGDPTRYAIFRYVGDAHEPVTVAALTEHFGLNHTAIRQHLAKLCAAGLLVDETATRTGRGRPAVVYRLSAAAAAAVAEPGAYEDLAVLLLAVIKSGRSARDVGFDAGRRAQLADAPGLDDAARVQHELGRRGFQPRRVELASSTELVLESCPYRTAAMVDPDIVCELHRGLAEGIAEAAGGRLRVTDLAVNAADTAGCRLRLSPVAPTGPETPEG